MQQMLVCYAGCVKLAPRLQTCTPSVGVRRASVRLGPTDWGSEEEQVLFPRLTDDGYSFYDDRFVSSGGSEEWLQNLKGTLGYKVLQARRPGTIHLTLSHDACTSRHIGYGRTSRACT